MKAIFCLAILLMATNAWGAPFLVCDVPPAEQQITQYEVYQDGVLLATVDAEGDGSLRYDLVAVTPGAYDWTAKALNVWGVSVLSDPYVSPDGAGKPTSLRMEP